MSKRTLSEEVALLEETVAFQEKLITAQRDSMERDRELVTRAKQLFTRQLDGSVELNRDMSRACMTMRLDISSEMLRWEGERAIRMVVERAYRQLLDFAVRR